MARASSPSKRIAGTIAVPVLALLALAAGCGGSSSSESAAPSAAPATEVGSDYQIVPDAVVTQGLGEVRRHAVAARDALAGDQPAAEQHVKEAYDAWFSFEGTVRKNDKALYLQMEDGLGAIKAGVQQNRPDKVQRGMADLEDGSSKYLAAHP